MTDIDSRLSDYGRRWQAGQSAPPPFDPSQATWARPGRGDDRRRVVQVIVAVAAVCAVVAGVVVALPGRGSVTVSAGRNTDRFLRSGVPIAAPPLLVRLPRATKPVQVASGKVGSDDWRFYVQVSALTAVRSPERTDPGLPGVGPPDHLGPGLCLMMRTVEPDGGGGAQVGCDDPAKMASLKWELHGRRAGFDADLVYGVTTASADRVIVSFGENHSTVTAPALSKSELPGLRFYVARVPPGGSPAHLEVEALAADGIPLVRSDPGLPAVSPSPPAGPSIPAPSPPGTYPLWPADPAGAAGTAGRNSATAVARDFSTSALGVVGNSITHDPNVPVNGPTFVTIELPTSGRSLSVLASPSRDGAWALIQVGDQAQLRGITYGSSGPTMAIQPPGDANQADVTELADGSIRHLHLTQAELDTGAVKLAGQSIHNVLVVYRNSAGVTVDAIGGEFG